MQTPNKTKRRRIWLVVIAAVLLAVLVTPVRLNYKDGGTVNWRAITWEYYKWHRMEVDEAEPHEVRFLVGGELYILGIKVLDNTRIVGADEA